MTTDTVDSFNSDQIKALFVRRQDTQGPWKISDKGFSTGRKGR